MDFAKWVRQGTLKKRQKTIRRTEDSGRKKMGEIKCRSKKERSKRKRRDEQIKKRKKKHKEKKRNEEMKQKILGK